MAPVGLEAAAGLVLHTILSKLRAQEVAAVGCTSTRLRAAASDEILWRNLCARDFSLDPAAAPVDSGGNPCSSFKMAYKLWFESFCMYPFPLVKRVKQLWDSIGSWMSVNFQEAKDTLRTGASEAEIQRTEETLGVKFPIATKILYRFCDGQNTLSNVHLAHLGIMGGYEFYDHVINVHLLPLHVIVRRTKDFAAFAKQYGFTFGSKCVIVAESFYSEKWIFLNCEDGQLYVGTKNVFDGEMLPCVPPTLLRHDIEGGFAQDALLLWLEEHCRRLLSGSIKTRVVREDRSIFLFPESPPLCSSSVTSGVQVRSSAVFVPEMSDLNGDDKYFFSYSIRISLLPEGCMLDGTYYETCQLHSRHWVFRSGVEVVSDIHGEGVIGKYPLLSPGKEEFVYESCTPLATSSGSAEGSFTFVTGRLGNPYGRQFDAKVGPFILEVPDYIF